MAGGYGFKVSPKGKNLIKNKNEVLGDASTTLPLVEPKNFSGTLFPGQSVEINPIKSEKKINWSQEFITKSLTQEQSLFVNQHTQEVNKDIQEIRLEIKKLAESVQELDSEIQKATDQNIPEINDYQLGFLQRLKKIIVQFRQNIDQSSIWLNNFNHKKSRKNAFWGNVRNKKSGGEQYLFSNEHSVSRSAN